MSGHDAAGSEVAVACCQLALAVGAPEANRAAAADAVRAAARAGANVVVLPELCSSGYVFSGREEAEGLAETLDGPTVLEWTALAREHRLVIVGGLCERGQDGLHNSSLILDRSGLRAVYRKAHLWNTEKLVFVPGEIAPPVLATEYGRIATMVCYDLEFPEWVRWPALAGAELLCAPTNWPREAPVPAGERPAEVVRVLAGASVNRMFIAACDRAGHERGTDWVGGTVIAGPDGYPLAGPVCAEDAVTVHARCRLADAREKRISPRNDVLADRRPALYDGDLAGAMNAFMRAPATPGRRARP